MRFLFGRRSRETAQSHFSQGAFYWTRGMVKKAESHFRQSIGIDSGFAEAHNSLGMVYERLGKRKKALQEFETAVRLKPDFADAHNNLGLAYDKIGQTRRAISLVQRAISLRPDYAQARYNLAVLYLVTGRKDLAFAEYTVLQGMNATLAGDLNVVLSACESSNLETDNPFVE